MSMTKEERIAILDFANGDEEGCIIYDAFLARGWRVWRGWCRNPDPEDETLYIHDEVWPVGGLERTNAVIAQLQWDVKSLDAELTRVEQESGEQKVKYENALRHVITEKVEGIFGT